jgi:hypothetical protein
MPLKVNLAHHPLDAFGGVVDLGHDLPQDPAGYVLRGRHGRMSGRTLDRSWVFLDASESQTAMVFWGA